jgi:type IV pilus assembly protein PilQ
MLFSRTFAVLSLAALLAVPRVEAAFPRTVVSLDLRDADVRDVIWAFAKEHKFSVIIGEDVKGTVTVSFRDVPVQTAFDSILQNAGLGYTVEGNIYRVNSMATIKANRAIEPLVTRAVTLNYFTTRFGASSSAFGSMGGGGESARGGPQGGQEGDDLGQLKQSLETHLSGTAGSSVSVVPRTNTLLITDIVSNVDRLVAMVKQLDVPTPQVLIEAKIVEVDANFSRDLGISTGFNAARTTNTRVGGGANPNFQTNGTTSGPNGQILSDASSSAFDFFLSSIGASNVTNLQIILTAAEQNGLARTLATPRVTTLNNKEAVVSSGQRIPFTTLGTVAAQGGTNLVATVQFVDAALELAVTPHVTNDNTILMKVRASRNSADFSDTVFQNPTINTREARNEVLVADGDTIVIGGIYTDDDIRSRGGTPYLQDIPVLGHLFRQTARSKDTVELIFLVTPRVVKDATILHPTAASQSGAGSLALQGTAPVH